MADVGGGRSRAKPLSREDFFEGADARVAWGRGSRSDAGAQGRFLFLCVLASLRECIPCFLILDPVEAMACVGFKLGRVGGVG